MKHNIFLFKSFSTIVLIVSTTVFTQNSIAQKAVRLDSTGNYIEVPHSTSLSPAQFTIEFWLRVLKLGNSTVAGGEQEIIDKRDFNSGGGYNIRLAGTSFPLTLVAVSSEPNYTMVFNAIYPQIWYHIAVTQDNDTTRIYLNGTLAVTKQNKYISNTFSNLRIGEFIGYPGLSVGLHGDLDDIRIWDYVRSEVEIKAMMNQSLNGNEDGLEAYWKFDNDTGSIIHDATTYHNNGTLYGNIHFITSNAPIDFIPPPAPVGLYAFSDQNDLILSWKNIHDSSIISYKIFRGEEPNFMIDDNSLITTITSADSSFVDEAILPAKDYYYRISSISEKNESNPSKISFGRLSQMYDDYLTGVYYYPWWGTGGMPQWLNLSSRNYFIPKQPPFLGEYLSSNPVVIRQHLDWMETYGIDFIVISWLGLGSEVDNVIKNSILPELINRQIKFTIYYELHSIFSDGEVIIDSVKEDKLVSDFKYIANTYFNHPNFLTINNRPVVFLYSSSALSGNFVQAFERVRNELKNIGYDLFLVGDEMNWGTPSAQHMQILDAVSPYIMYGLPNHNGYPLDVDFFADISLKANEWEAVCKSEGKLFIPNAHPGFNDRAPLWGRRYVFPRQISKGYKEASTLEEYIKVMQTFVNPLIKMIMITSWNEWQEDTQIEPTIITPPTNLDQSSTGVFYTQGYTYEGYDTKYLEIVRELLASSLLTNLDDIHISNSEPYKFRLEQNYPNPFNQSTTFEYKLPRTEFVSLKIYNIYGNLITTLISEVQTTGNYEINWTAEKYPNGVYFCRFQSLSFIDTKKIILLK